MQQSTSTSSLSFLWPSSLVHGIRELSSIQSISLMPHHRYAKRRKSQQSQVRQRREKRNLDTLYDGQVNSNRLSAQTMGTPNCHVVHYYWHWNFDIIATVICTFGSSPRPTVVLLSDCWPSRSSSSTTWWRTSLLSGCGWTQSMSSAGER